MIAFSRIRTLPRGRRLVPILAVGAALLLWASAIDGIWRGRSEALHRADLDIAREAERLGEVASQAFIAVDRFLLELGHRFVAEPSTLDIDRRLAEAPDIARAVALVQIAATDGALLKSSRIRQAAGEAVPALASHVGMSLSSGGGMSIGLPSIGLSGSDWTIPVVRTMVDSTGKNVGAVAAHLRASALRDMIAERAPRDRVELRLADAGPLVVAGDGVGDTDRLLAAYASPSVPLLTVVERRKAVALAEWRRDSLIEAAKAAAGSLVIFGAAVLSRRRDRSSETSAVAVLENAIRADSTLRALNDGVFEWDLKTGIVKISSQLEIALGLTIADGENARDALFSRFHPDDGATLTQRLREFLKGGDLLGHGYHRLRGRDGIFRTHDIRIAVDRDAGGRALRIVGGLTERTDLGEGSPGRPSLSDAGAEQSDRLATILDALSDGYLIYDAQDRLVHCNARYREMYPAMAEVAAPGISFLEMCQAFIDRGLVDPAPLTREEWIAARMTQHRSPPSAAVNRRDGGRWILRREQRLPDGGAISIHTDVTDLKRQAGATEARRELLETTLNHIGQGVVAFDAEGRVLFANRRYGELLDIPASLLLPGTPGIEILRHMARAGEYGDGDVETLAKDLMERFTTWPRPFYGQRTRPNGMTVQAMVADLPNGGALFTVADVSERKRHETEIEGQRSRLQAIIAHAPIAIAVFDRAERLVLRNGAYLRMGSDNGVDVAIGTTLTQLVRTAVEQAVDDPAARDAELARRLEDIRRPPPHVSERSYRDRRIMEVHTGGLPDGGTIRFYVDVTERRRMDKIKSEFVSTVSHELRTPLTSIAGSLGLIAGGVAGALPEKAGDLIAIARANSDRLVRLVSDILDMEKIESGRLEFRMRAQPIGPILRQAIDANRGYAERFGVNVALAEMTEGALAEVDEDRLDQVITNLLSNAVKFSPAGETVAVRLTGGPNGGSRIEVADKGPGIPADFRERVFQPFAQADGTDARRLGGTGLGLSIAKSIVERMRGSIGFETAAGVGTRFFVDLPKPGER